MPCSKPLVPIQDMLLFNVTLVGLGVVAAGCCVGIFVHRPKACCYLCFIYIWFDATGSHGS